MTNYNLIFYADNGQYKNKKFKIKLQESNWLNRSYEILDLFFSKGNQIRSAMLVIDHLNKLNQIITSQTITIPTEVLYPFNSSK